MSDSSQGPGWWQASDGKWYPPEQAPSTSGGNPTSQQPGPGATTVNVGEALTYGWNKFTQNIGQLLVAAIVGFVIFAVLAIIGYVILFATAFASTDPDCRITDAGNLVCDSGSDPSLILVLLGWAISLALIYLGQFLFDMFMIRVGLLVTAGEEVETGRVFSMDRVGPYIIGALIMTVLALIGFVLCIIPGLLVLLFGRFFGFYILDKGQSPADAIKSSVNLVKDNLGTILLFVIAAMVINWIGAAICGIGLLVTVPVTAIATAYVYRQAEGQPIAA